MANGWPKYITMPDGTSWLQYEDGKQLRMMADGSVLNGYGGLADPSTGKNLPYNDSAGQNLAEYPPGENGQAGNASMGFLIRSGALSGAPEGTQSPYPNNGIAFLEAAGALPEGTTTDTYLEQHKLAPQKPWVYAPSSTGQPSPVGQPSSTGGAAKTTNYAPENTIPTTGQDVPYKPLNKWYTDSISTDNAAVNAAGDVGYWKSAGLLPGLNADAWKYEQGVSNPYYQNKVSKAGNLPQYLAQTDAVRQQQAGARAEELSALGMLKPYATGEQSVARQQAEVERESMAQQIASQVAGRAYDPAAVYGGQMAYAKGSADLGAKSAIAAAQERQSAISALMGGAGQMRTGDANQFGQESTLGKSLRDYELGKDTAAQSWYKTGLGDKVADYSNQQDWQTKNMATNQWNLSQGLRAAGREGDGTDYGAIVGGGLAALGGLASLVPSDKNTKTNVRSASNVVHSGRDCKEAIARGDYETAAILERAAAVLPNAIIPDRAQMISSVAPVTNGIVPSRSVAPVTSGVLPMRAAAPVTNGILPSWDGVSIQSRNDAIVPPADLRFQGGVRTGGILPFDAGDLRFQGGMRTNGILPSDLSDLRIQGGPFIGGPHPQYGKYGHDPIDKSAAALDKFNVAQMIPNGYAQFQPSMTSGGYAGLGSVKQSPFSAGVAPSMPSVTQQYYRPQFSAPPAPAPVTMRTSVSPPVARTTPESAPAAAARSQRAPAPTFNAVQPTGLVAQPKPMVAPVAMPKPKVDPSAFGSVLGGVASVMSSKNSKESVLNGNQFVDAFLKGLGRRMGDAAKPTTPFDPLLGAGNAALGTAAYQPAEDEPAEAPPADLPTDGPTSPTMGTGFSVPATGLDRALNQAETDRKSAAIDASGGGGWMTPGRAAAMGQIGKGIGGIIQGATQRPTWRPINSIGPVQYGSGPMGGIAASLLSDIRAKSEVEPATHPSIEEVLGRPNPAMRFDPMVVHRSRDDEPLPAPVRDERREWMIENAIPPMPDDMIGKRARWTPETKWEELPPKNEVVDAPRIPDELKGQRSRWTSDGGWEALPPKKQPPRFVHFMNRPVAPAWAASGGPQSAEDIEEQMLSNRGTLSRERPATDSSGMTEDEIREVDLMNYRDGMKPRERPAPPQEDPPLTSEAVEQFMDPLRAKTYKYKEPFASQYGHDTKLGIIAQDAQKSRLGQEIVFRDPKTGMLALDLSPQKFGPITLASLANLNQRLDKLEGRRAGSK